MSNNKITKSIEIHGLRWFQKSYGNTYHTVAVVIDGETVYTSERTYGYGSSYQQTAMAWLIENGYVDASEKHWCWQFVESLKASGIVVIDCVNDVPRQKDLHK